MQLSNQINSTYQMTLDPHSKDWSKNEIYIQIKSAFKSMNGNEKAFLKKFDLLNVSPLTLHKEYMETAYILIDPLVICLCREDYEEAVILRDLLHQVEENMIKYIQKYRIDIAEDKNMMALFAGFMANYMQIVAEAVQENLNKND